MRKRELRATFSFPQDLFRGLEKEQHDIVITGVPVVVTGLDRSVDVAEEGDIRHQTEVV